MTSLVVRRPLIDRAERFALRLGANSPPDERRAALAAHATAIATVSRPGA